MSAGACTACQAGTFSTALGANNTTICVACSPGTYSHIEGGASGCTPCPLNTNATSAGASACTLNPSYFDVTALNLFRRFTYASLNFQTRTWSDLSSNRVDGVVSGNNASTVCASGNGANGTLCALQGLSTDQVDFGYNAVPSRFTLCSLTRLTSTNGVSPRILSENRLAMSSSNWLHGHALGQTCIAMYGQGTWKTPNDGTENCAGAITHWVLLCGQNDPSSDYVVNNNGVLSVPPFHGGSAPGSLGVNSFHSSYASQLAEFAIAEMTIWNTTLSSAVLSAVARYYMGVLAGTIPQSEAIMALPCTGTPSCTNASKPQCLAGGTYTCCPMGTFWLTAATQAAGCRACPVGAYGDGATCYSCAAGSYASAVSTATCTPCAAGAYSTASGATSNATCTACQAGAFSTRLGAAANATCALCPAGTFAALPGASTCALCAVGHYSTALGVSTSAACARCVAGAYSTVSGAVTSAACSACALGSYAPSDGASTCVLCSAGTYGPQVGASECVACVGGSSSSTVGATSVDVCLTCGAGAYATSVGAAYTCVNCSAGTYATATGALSSAICAACASGAYAPPGASACVACVGGTYSNASISCPACPPGTYSHARAPTCTPCPPHTSSPAPGTASLLGCACEGGYYCLFTKRISVTVTLHNTSLADFTPAVQASLIAAVAAAAGVPPSGVSIVAATQQQGRRGLPHAHILQLEVVGAAAFDADAFRPPFAGRVAWHHSHSVRTLRAHYHPPSLA